MDGAGVSSPSVTAAAGAAETPTVCGSGINDRQLSQSPTHDTTIIVSSSESTTKSLKDRIPIPLRITVVLRRSEEINFLFVNSAYDSDEGKDMIYNDALWESVNDKVHESLQLCAAGCETDVKKMMDLYQKSTRQIINAYASKLYQQFPPSH